MEQLLTDQDKKEAVRYVNTQNGTLFPHENISITKQHYNAGIIEGFHAACSYKNNQMQEFDKWKQINGWVVFNHGTGNYEQYSDTDHYKGEKSFSELFEIFIKETSKT